MFDEQVVVQGRRAVHHAVERSSVTGHVDCFGPHETVTRAQGLPIDGQHPVALQIAERSVVAQDVETVVGAFESPTWPVTPIRPVARIGAHDGQLVVGRHLGHMVGNRAFGQCRVGVQHGRDDLVLAVGIPVDQVDPRTAVNGIRTFDTAEHRRRHGFHCVTVVGEVARPHAATFGNVDPTQERRDDLAQLGQHHVGIQPSFGQRM